MVVCVVGSYYIELRGANGTQKEHMDIVPACADVISKYLWQKILVIEELHKIWKIQKTHIVLEINSIGYESVYDSTEFY